MEKKFRFFLYDVIEDGEGYFQVNGRRLQRGFITLEVDDDGYALADDYDIISAVKEKWCDEALEIWNGGDTGGTIEFEQADSGCPIGQLVPEDQICQPI